MTGLDVLLMLVGYAVGGLIGIGIMSLVGWFERRKNSRRIAAYRQAMRDWEWERGKL